MYIFLVLPSIIFIVINAFFRPPSLSRRSPDEEEDRFDASGHRILRVVRREATDVADLRTEKVIQVLAPNDVQFALTSEDREEVVISSGATTTSALLSGEAVCIDTPAFVGVTISFLMILVSC